MSKYSGYSTIIKAIFNSIPRFFSLLMGIIFLTFPKLHTFKCERIEPLKNIGQCELKSQGIFGSESQYLSIDSLQTAKVEERTVTHHDTEFGGGTSQVYRVFIVTREGNFPLSTRSRGGTNQKSKHQHIAEDINKFINYKTQESLFIEQDDRFVNYLAIIFCVVGIFLIIDETNKN